MRRAYMHPHDRTVCVVDVLDADGHVAKTWNVPWCQAPAYAQALPGRAHD